MSSGQSNFELKANHKTKVTTKSQAKPFSFSRIEYVNRGVKILTS